MSGQRFDGVSPAPPVPNLGVLRTTDMVEFVVRLRLEGGDPPEAWEPVIAHEMALLPTGALGIVRSGRIVACYAPGRWLEFYQSKDKPGGTNGPTV